MDNHDTQATNCLCWTQLVVHQHRSSRNQEKIDGGEKSRKSKENLYLPSWISKTFLSFLFLASQSASLSSLHAWVSISCPVSLEHVRTGLPLMMPPFPPACTKGNRDRKQRAGEEEQEERLDEPKSGCAVCVGVICINSGYCESLSIQMQISTVASDVEPRLK